MKKNIMVAFAFMELPERNNIEEPHYKVLILTLNLKFKDGWKLDDIEVINNLPINTKAFYGDSINDKDFATATILEREVGKKKWIWDNGYEVPQEHQMDLVLGKTKQDVVDYFSKLVK